MKSRMTLRRIQNYKKQIIYWKDGSVFRSYIRDGKVETEEYLYCHFQKKHPKSINADINKPRAFLLNNDRFIELKEDISVETVGLFADYISEKNDKMDEILYYKKKILAFLECPIEDKNIWVRRKRFSKSF